MLRKHVDVIALAIAVLGLLASEARWNRPAPKIALSAIRIHNAIARVNVCPFTRVKFLPKFQ